MGETITQIGRYEISRQLVDTALASVYDAFDPVERKPVAIRVPRTTQHGLDSLARALRHPGLMNVLSCEQNQGESFVVLEPFQGTPLDRYLEDGRKMELLEVLGLLRQLASVLDYAHAHGSIHGSLHPSSVLLNERQEIKILDLGASADGGRSASPEQLLRAIHYLSPECVRDQPMDGRSDQFSLAVLAHRMLIGELPFPGTPLGVLFRIAYQGVERDAIRDLPPAAQTVFRRSLAKRASERYATCGEMVETLENALVRKAPAPTRLADSAMFAPPQPVAPPIPVVSPAARRHFSGEALKYFGLTFAACVLILGAAFYFLVPKVPKVAPLAVPAASQPAPKPAPPAAPAAQPVVAPVKSPPVQAKAASKAHTAKKKTEPEMELKPAEPKIIR